MVLTDWHVLLTKAVGFLLRPGATVQDLARYEERLGATLPGRLKELYLVSDGVYDERGGWFVIWPLEELAGRNEAQWAEDDPRRRELLAFGDDGTGTPFCVPRDGSPSVFSWSPVEACAHWLANDIADFWAAWAAGTVNTHITPAG